MEDKKIDTNIEIEDVVLNEEDKTNVNENEFENLEKSITEKVVEGISGLFKKEEQEEKKEEIKKDNLSYEEIEDLIEKKAQEKIDILARKTKENAKRRAEIERKLENVQDEFKEFIEFKIKKDNNFNIDDYLEKNKHVLKKLSTTTSVVESSKPQNINNSDLNYLNKLKK